jgi:glycosyltransferase involved in cell wall biosynthesis
MRYFIECTHTSESSLNTGIQRVVRNIVNQSQVRAEGAGAGASQRDIVPVVYRDGALRMLPGLLPPPVAARPAPQPGYLDKAVLATKIYLRNVYVAARQLACALLPWAPWVSFLTAPRQQWGLTRILLLPRTLLRQQQEGAALPAIAPQAGDVLVLLDSSWHLDLWPAVHAAKAQGVAVVCVIYDLIPYTHPQFCDGPLVSVFNRWMAIALREADAFICISRTVADALVTLVPRLVPERTKPVLTSHFWLGSELDPRGTPAAPPADIAGIIASPDPVYLYVSTIEPRKNHAYALDAFEALWASGIRARLVIVGRIGWHCDALLERIHGHDEFGKQLFMLNGIDDHALSSLYDRANGLVFTSFVEGFGLPLVEALQRGVPVFASDIPVFREIAGEGVHFVNLDAPQSLQAAVAAHITAGAARLDAPVPWLSWKDSAAQFWVRLDETLAGLPQPPAK